MTNARQDTLQRKIDREKMPVPVTGIFDFPYYLKRINTTWYKHISGMVSGLYELSAWDDTDSNVKRAIDEIHAWLSEGLTVIENCEQVQNCMSDTVKDIYNGLYVADDTLASSNGILRINRYYQSNQNIFITYPELPHSFISNDAVKNDAFCGAVFFWLQAYKEKYRQYVELINTGSVAATTIGVVLAAINPALIGVGLGIVAAWFSENINDINDNLSALDNNSALDEYTCRLQNLLSGESITFDGYKSAIQLAKTAGGYTEIDAQIIANLLYDTLQIEQSFLYLIELFDTNAKSYSGAGGECDCIVDTECVGATYYTFPAIPYLNPHDTRVIHNGIETIGSESLMCWRFPSYTGGIIAMSMPRRCYGYIQFARKGVNVSGTGTLLADFYIDGVFTETATLSAGSTSTLETVYFFTDNLHHACSTIEMRFRSTGTIDGLLEIRAIRFNVRGTP